MVSKEVEVTTTATNFSLTDSNSGYKAYSINVANSMSPYVNTNVESYSISDNGSYAAGYCKIDVSNYSSLTVTFKMYTFWIKQG